MQRLHNEQLASALEVSAVDIFERSFFDSAWNDRSIWRYHCVRMHRRRTMLRCIPPVAGLADTSCRLLWD